MEWNVREWLRMIDSDEEDVIVMMIYLDIYIIYMILNIY